MSWWPFIEVKAVTEKLAAKELTDDNSFFQQLADVLLEEEWGNQVVLVFDYVANYCLHCADLIVLKGHIDSWSVEVHVFIVLFLNLIPIEHRETVLEEFRIAISKQAAHWSAVEGKNRRHVRTVVFQEWFKEHLWLWLVLYQFKNITLSDAHVETLEKEQFSQSDFMYSYLINVWEIIFWTFCRFYTFSVFSSCGLSGKLLNNPDLLLVCSKIKLYEILLIYFQVIDWF